MVAKLLFITADEIDAGPHRPSSACARVVRRLHGGDGVGARRDHVRQLDVRRRRQQGGRRARSACRPPAPRPSCSCSCRARRGWSACCSPSASTRSRPTPATVEEFDYIIAAVVGGTLLTGGYGTALGGALGACIVAMATLGIPFARWNSDWRFMFLGVTLLLAMLANRSIRTKAEAMRR